MVDVVIPAQAGKPVSGPKEGIDHCLNSPSGFQSSTAAINM